MANPKDILVITTSSIDGLKVKRYLKPISAHIVAGTNLFSDFLGGLTDVFGGRSQTYQKQLTSLYNEAIERIKIAAYEMGANCIMGLRIDMDEISGKGKSMFMLTAIGTAVILETELIEKSPLPVLGEKFEYVGIYRINMLRTKKHILQQADSNELVLNDEIWSFITTNQVDKVFPFLLKIFSKTIADEEIYPGKTATFQRQFTSYIDALPENVKLDFLYGSIQSEQYEPLILKLAAIVRDLNLFDFNRVMQLLKGDNFQTQKVGLCLSKFDKPFYNKEDIKDLQAIKNYVKEIFIERGTRTVKKQLLSSKEKEVWTCECGKTNDIDSNCSGCAKDIYGFKSNEVKPDSVENYIQEKIDLIKEYVE